jgi:geranylgeranyl pyrophosphate synthase
MAEFKPPSAEEWIRCDEVIDALVQLPSAMEEMAASGGLCTDDPILTLAFTPGKRLRPALLLLAAQLGGLAPKDVLRAAAAIELLHSASLYHDDVIDQSHRRRGLPTAFHTHGAQIAVLAGTYLFATALQEFARLGSVQHRISARAAAALCAGELREIERAYDFDLSWSDHLDNLQLKTATLFALPCVLGGTLAHLDAATLRALGTYGRSIGIAFQLMDDLLDIEGDAEVTGKDVQGDLQAGVYSLPVLVALRSRACGSELRDILSLSKLQPNDVDRAVQLVVDGGGVQASRAAVKHYTRTAVSSLADLPSGDVRDSLTTLTAFTRRRRA